MTQPVSMPTPTPTTAPAGTTLVEARGVSKTFRMGDAPVTVLSNANLAVRAGEFVAIEGRSGSGKSTMLHLLGVLDTPDVGSIYHNGIPVSDLSSDMRSKLRNQTIGFVFQFYHLLPELSVVQNVMLPGLVKHSIFSYFRTKRELRDRAVGLLTQFGLGHRLRHRPNQLSGGERQRVAIARALMNQPMLLLADEPTGNLDAETGRQIMAVIEGLHASGQTVVMVTHDRTLARRADRVLVLRDGRLHPAQ